jgi:hypothetical protein
VLGIVRFDPYELDAGPGEGRATTTATFTEPGDYVLITQMLAGAYDMQC